MDDLIKALTAIWLATQIVDKLSKMATEKRKGRKRRR